MKVSSELQSHLSENQQISSTTSSRAPLPPRAGDRKLESVRPFVEIMHGILSGETLGGRSSTPNNITRSQEIRELLLYQIKISEHHIKIEVAAKLADAALSVARRLQQGG